MTISPLSGPNLLLSAPQEKKFTQAAYPGRPQVWVPCGVQTSLPKYVIAKNPTKSVEHVPKVKIQMLIT